MKKSEFICANCLAFGDADHGDLMKNLCTLLPDWRPVHPDHHCASGVWRGQKFVPWPNDPEMSTLVDAILSWGEWESE